MSTSAPSPASTQVADAKGTGTPSRIGRVLGVVRWLIGYGRQLAATVQQRASAPGFALFARPFGTTDLAVILARIAAGLRRAEALEAALDKRAARGRDLTPAPLRMPSLRAPLPPGQLPSDPPAPPPPNPTQDPRLARLPTEEEIAAEVRRRPVGAVIVDICHDLGIAPGRLDRAFWDELAHAIIAYGGSLVRFFGNLDKRLSAIGFGGPADPAEPGWPAAPPDPLAPATGPP